MSRNGVPQMGSASDSSYKRRLQTWFRNGDDIDDDDEHWGEDSVVKKAGYSFDDGQRLMFFIHAFDLHEFVCGNVIWQEIAKLRILSTGRTWSSLREHFTKTVMNDLDAYKVTEEDIRKFGKLKRANKKGTKHCVTPEVMRLLKELYDRRKKNDADGRVNDAGSRG